MRQLVLATHNRGKVRELQAILSGIDVVLLAGDEVDLPDVEETGDTFTANALLKAQAGVAATGLACVADDSGLAVDALGGAPGIHSARWARQHDREIGAEGVDEANVALLLEQLQDVEEADRGARFVCAAVLALPDGRNLAVEETLEGMVTDAPRGTGGFGYDPIFQPAGETKTTAEMSPAYKHSISHRGKAFRAIRPVIARHVLD